MNFSRVVVGRERRDRLVHDLEPLQHVLLLRVHGFSIVEVLRFDEDQIVKQGNEIGSGIIHNIVNPTILIRETKKKSQSETIKFTWLRKSFAVGLQLESRTVMRKKTFRTGSSEGK